MDFTFNYILSQILTIFAYILLIRTYFLKNKRKITTLSIISTILTACAYVCLGAWTGFAMMLIALLRNLYILQRDSHRKQRTQHDLILLAVFLLGIILTTIPTCTGPLSLLPVFSTAIYTYSLWQKNTKVYKFCGIPTELFGIAYNVYIGSIFGIIMETVLFTAAAIGYASEIKSSRKSPTPAQDTVQ